MMNHQKWCICPNFQFSHKVYYKGGGGRRKWHRWSFYTFDTANFMGEDEACQLKALVMTVGFERVAHFSPFLLYINLRGHSE